VYSFASIIDQQRPVSILNTLLKKNAIPHALLFTGIEGIGKKRAALTFAMAANCRAGERLQPPLDEPDIQRAEDQTPLSLDEPCGQCRSCRKIISNTHPDIIQVKPTGKVTRIAQIRSLCDTLAMRPYEASLRVVVIAEAQSMNLSAGNALLKLLEEPPDRTILILIAPQTADLLPTIVSRCRHIRFNPVSKEQIVAKLLDDDAGINAEEAAIIAGLADGSLTRAIDMNRSNWADRRDWIITNSGLERPDALGSRSTGLLLAFAEHLSKNKKEAIDALAIMITWLRDMIVCRYTPDKVINRDTIDRLEEVSYKISVRSLADKIKTIQVAQKNIDANSNLRLTLEAMMLRLTKDCDKGF
jgi:DNA polymerase-3 subunit delta'